MLFGPFHQRLWSLRQGLPTLDPHTTCLSRLDSGKASHASGGETFVLLPVAWHLAGPPQFRDKAALVPVTAARSLRSEKTNAWLAMTLVLGLLFLFGQWSAWRQLAGTGFYVSPPQQLLCLLLTGAHAST